jgi:Condensation domain
MEELARFSGGVRRTGPLQLGLSQLEWLSYRSGGHGLLPNLSWVVAVPDGLPDDAVADAVHTLLLRHEVLRTAFDADQDGRPQQSVYEDVLVVLPRVEDEDSRRLFVEATFDIATEPPIRFGRTSDGDLVFAAAHIATDGLGAWVLVADLTELLAAQEERRPARLRRTCRSRSTGPATSRRAAGPGSSQPCGTGTPPCATSR